MSQTVDVVAGRGHPVVPGAVLQVDDLSVSFSSEAGEVTAVRGVSFSVAKGEVLGIVGESGSGKSVTSLAIMGLLPRGARVAGSVTFRGDELLHRDDSWMSKIRGQGIAMVFQDPLSALTPVYTVGDQIVEAIRTHQSMPKAAARERAVELLDLVGIPNARERAGAFPHEFSGGMRQRAMIAMAMVNDPDVIIADEPTTALDVTIQAQILEVFKTAQEATGAAVVLITHDLGVVAGFADKVAVMYAGKIVESAPVDPLFAAPRMPYTIGLIGSIPRLDAGRGQPLTPIEGTPPVLVDLGPGCPFRPRCPLRIEVCDTVEPELVALGVGRGSACHRAQDIELNNWGSTDVFPTTSVPVTELESIPREQRDVVLEVRDLVKHYALSKGAVLRRVVGAVHAVDGVSFDIRRGETLGLVGESGCGKTSTIMEILGLEKPGGGSVQILGKTVGSLTSAEKLAIRRNMQVVFQDPMAALDPRLPVADIVGEPLRTHGVSGTTRVHRVNELLRMVGLDPVLHMARFPAEFSGGQRQRIGIARALALEPKILVLDEPVSALDVSIQAGVLNLLEQLKSALGLSYLFVAHDLSVVRHIADRVAVMYLGRIVEIGEVTELFGAPSHPYTQALLSAVPMPDPVAERSRRRILLSGDLPSPANPPPGCRFRMRCPKYATLDPASQQRCQAEDPQLAVIPGQPAHHTAACHFAQPVPVVWGTSPGQFDL